MDLTTNDDETELVLLIPPQLTQSAYQTLIRCHCVARPWHLQGRYGSRTHRVDQNYMGIPVLSCIKQQYYSDPELQDLFRTNGVELMQSRRQYDKKHKLETVDATIHPERAPTKILKNCPSFTPAFTYGELFAGIGGFGVALNALGGTCVFCSELDEDCQNVYASNFPETTNLYGNIYQVTDDQLPPMDLLVAGFPCQPFSRLGSQLGLEDPRGSLFLQIVRVLKVSQPKAFLLENVPGLLEMSAFKTIVTALEEQGYTVATEVCSARGLTATSRKRLFFVGIRNHKRQFQFPFIPDLKLRAHHVLSYDNDLEILHITTLQLERLCQNKRWKPAHLAWPDTVCATLDSHYGNTIAKGNSQLVPCRAPLMPRRFSPRECASIMGFPQSYLLPRQKQHQGDMAHLKQQYRMLGNAVCPPLIAALAGAVLAECWNNIEWESWGRKTAIRLAWEATILGKPNDV